MLFRKYNQLISFWVLICFPHLKVLPIWELVKYREKSLRTPYTPGALPILCLFHIEDRKFNRIHKNYMASESSPNPLLMPNIIHATLEMMGDSWLLSHKEPSWSSAEIVEVQLVLEILWISLCFLNPNSILDIIFILYILLIVFYSSGMDGKTSQCSRRWTLL